MFFHLSFYYQIVFHFFLQTCFFFTNQNQNQIPVLFLPIERRFRFVCHFLQFVISAVFTFFEFGRCWRWRYGKHGLLCLHFSSISHDLNVPHTTHPRWSSRDLNMMSRSTTCHCGQTWSDPNVPHMCEMVARINRQLVGFVFDHHAYMPIFDQLQPKGNMNNPAPSMVRLHTP